MSDLIKRLRDEPTWYEAKRGLSRPAMEVWHKTAIEAADEIERLDQRLTFAEEYGKVCDSEAALAEKEIDRLDKVTAEWSGWVSVDDQEPPDSSSYAVRSMYLICNQGFVTLGFWYPKAKKWHDADRYGSYNITSQVTHWAKMPTTPIKAGTV